MIFDRNGVLYAATGPNGKIFRIRGKNNGEVFFDSDATNVMALAFDRDGRLIAATQGKAYVFRVSEPRKAYVMFASEEDECRALAVDNSGNIYVAVNSSRMSSVFDRPSPGESDARSAGVTASATPTPAPPAGSALVVEVRRAMPSSEPQPFTLGGQSAIHQIQPNGFVSRFWQAPEGPIQALKADLVTNSILVAGGNKGKIYRLESDTNYSVVEDVEESTVLSFAQYERRILFTTANKASLYEFVTTPTQQGLFASRALNAGATVQWGNLMYEAEETTGSGIAFESRSGNTSQPEDKTWSQWTQAERIGPKLFKLQSPVAQYLQYRLTLKAAGNGESPVLDNVQIFNVQSNVPPIIRNIRVDKLGGEPSPVDLAILIAGASRRSAMPAPRSTPSSGRPGESPSPGGDGSTIAAMRSAMGGPSGGPQKCLAQDGIHRPNRARSAQPWVQFRTPRK